jgi:hypothetical protein
MFTDSYTPYPIYRPATTRCPDSCQSYTGITPITVDRAELISSKKMRFLDKVTRERKFGFSDSKLEHRQKCSRNDNIMIVLRIGSVRGVNDAQAAQRQWPI